MHSTVKLGECLHSVECFPIC